MKEILMKLISSFNIRSFLIFPMSSGQKKSQIKLYPLRNRKKNPIALKPILKLHLAWLGG